MVFCENVTLFLLSNYLLSHFIYIISCAHNKITSFPYDSICDAYCLVIGLCWRGVCPYDQIAKFVGSLLYTNIWCCFLLRKFDFLFLNIFFLCLCFPINMVTSETHNTMNANFIFEANLSPEYDQFMCWKDLNRYFLCKINMILS